MKTTEFRIGNYLKGQDVVKVRSIISENHVLIEGNATRFSVYAKKPYSACLEPIPITEEWLLGFGFEPQDDSEMLSIQVGNTMYLEYHPRHKMFAITPESWRGATSVWMWNDPKYVHQLQNLYFSLTGEEIDSLTLNNNFTS